MKMTIETAKTALPYTLLALGLVLLAAFHISNSRAATQELSTADRLMAIEEIHQLKARYMRCMDTKDWVCWEGVFAPNFRFKAGSVERYGGKEMVQSTHRSGLFDRVRTVSHAYTPEIEILSPTTARGTWAVDFMHYWPAGSGAVQGGEEGKPGTWNHTDGYYQDTYVKIDGKWLIQSEEIHAIRHTEGKLGE
jgi:SnoaL-like domain